MFNQINSMPVVNEITCSYCHSVINLQELNAAEQQQVLATHLCVNCQNVLKQAASILFNSNIVKNKVETKIVPSLSAEKAIDNYDQLLEKMNTSASKTVKMSAGKQCRALIFQAITKMQPEHIQMFCDEDTSKELFGILYPLFVKITGFNDVQIDNARKVRGFYRYFAKKYRILNNDYLMCNDLYERHIARFNNAFIDLDLINGEKIETATSIHKKRKNDDNIQVLDIDADLSSEEIIQQGATLPVSSPSKIPKKDLIDVISFDSNKNVQVHVVQRPKKTKEDLLKDIVEIEKQQKQAKVERLSKIKSKFNFSTKNLPSKKQIENSLMISEVND